MKTIVWALALLASFAAAAEGNGFVAKKSAFSVEETLNRLQKALEEKGVVIVARVEHSKAAEKVGIKLRPTALLIFGNPKLGSQFFVSRQTSGIDLPLKALAWEDEKGQVWIGYNDPQFIADRHGISDQAEVVKKMGGAMDSFTDIASKP